MKKFFKKDCFSKKQHGCLENQDCVDKHKKYCNKKYYNEMGNNPIEEQNCCVELEDKNFIVKKVTQVGGLTFFSKIFGIIREILLVNFLGLGAMSDAFIIAFKIPNTLKHLFAEGALSSAMVPSVVETLRNKNKEAVSKLISLAFLFFEGILLILCGLAIWKANLIIHFFAPGFAPEKMLFCIKLFKILIPFVFIISTTALLAGPLQAIGHFFVPAISPFLLNCTFVLAIFICTVFNFSVETFCYFILLAGLLQFLLHFIAYFGYGFSLKSFDKEVIVSFAGVMKKFLPCVFSMSMVEIDALIDTMFGSYLKDGTVSLISYAERFMSIPLNVCGIAVATVLLPYFSKLISSGLVGNNSKVKFYILEASKFAFWTAIPLIIFMIFFSDKIFTSLFSNKFDILKAQEAGSILVAYLFGVLFFSLSKILLNVFYANHNMWVPTAISVIGSVVNCLMNMVLINIFGSTGLALATSISALVQVVLYLFLLNEIFGINFDLINFGKFFSKYLLQLSVIFVPVYFIYKLFYNLIANYTGVFANFLLNQFGFWLWTLPVLVFGYFLIYKTRKFFKTDSYFVG